MSRNDMEFSFSGLSSESDVLTWTVEIISEFFDVMFGAKK